MNLLQEQIDRQKDRKLNAQFSLWNAIITLDGLVIGATSILFSLNPTISKTMVIIICILAFIPIIILTINYFITRRFYSFLENIDQTYIEKVADAFETEKQKGGRRAASKRKLIVFFEIAALSITFLNIILCLFLIAYS